jgi:hypothetical protein
VCRESMSSVSRVRSGQSYLPAAAFLFFKVSCRDASLFELTLIAVGAVLRFVGLSIDTALPAVLWFRGYLHKVINYKEVHVQPRLQIRCVTVLSRYRHIVRVLRKGEARPLCAS